MSTTVAEVVGTTPETPSREGRPARHDEILVNDARPVRYRRQVTDLWSQRRLIMVLARKDFYVRYRRSWLGLFWVLLVPLAQAAVLALVFSRLGRFSSGTPHYQVYVFSGYLAWSFFSASLMAGSTSIVDGKELAGRIYFPRSVLPIVKLATDSFGLLTSTIILVVLSVVFGVHLGAGTLLLVPAAALLLALTAGFNLVLSALHVHFRDVRFIVTTAMMPWFYVTPIIYTPQQLHGTLRRVVSLNPVGGVLDTFRAATVGAGPDWRTSVPIACVAAAILLAVGGELHRRLDRNLIDKL